MPRLFPTPPPRPACAPSPTWCPTGRTQPARRCPARPRDFWRNAWTGRSLMAIGMKDPVLGPPVMRSLHSHIRNCPPPLEIADGGHFLQEWGDTIAHKAVDTL